MAKINTISCLTGLGNTGFGSCFLVPAFMGGAFRVPESFELTEADVATPTALRAKLVAAAMADSQLNRIYPLHDFRTLTDNSTEATVQTFSDQSQSVVLDGNYDLTFQYLDGGLCLHMNLRTWNYTGGYYLFYDKKGVIYGWRKQKADGTYVIGGIPALFHANKMALNTGTEVANFSVRFSFDSMYLNDKGVVGFVQAGFTLREIKGLQTLALTPATPAPLAGLINLSLYAGCDDTNLGPVIGTDVADPALFVVKNAATGAIIDVDTAVYSATTETIAIQLDTTDPDYPATTTADVTITLVGPTALDAADVTGYEANTITVKRG